MFLFFLLVYSLTFELYFFPKNIKDPSLSYFGILSTPFSRLGSFFSSSKKKIKGGDPATRSRTATLLRLSANHEIHRDLDIIGTSGAPHFQRLTGGVYKARERIHGAVMMRHY